MPRHSWSEPRTVLIKCLGGKSSPFNLMSRSGCSMLSIAWGQPSTAHPCRLLPGTPAPGQDILLAQSLSICRPEFIYFLHHRALSGPHESSMKLTLWCFPQELWPTEKETLNLMTFLLDPRKQDKYVQYQSGHRAGPQERHTRQVENRK